MTDIEQTKPSPMIRIADLLHLALKLARKRWYVILALLALLLIFASLVLLTIWKVHKVQVVIKQLKEDNPKADFKKLDQKFAKRPLTLLDLYRTQVSDISALKGMHLEWLRLDRTQVSDISVLNGMPLKELYFNRTQVTDISALKGMPLEKLDLNGTQVSDISALKGMPLIRLILPTSAKNIEWLKDVKTLDNINGRPATAFWEEYDAQKKYKSKSQNKQSDN
ncbi:MAG: hypothetical protein MJH11_12770 [Lentisphaeria bacterium]|nr:hypothetical protein [Lentisphaeria bacterium]